MTLQSTNYLTSPITKTLLMKSLPMFIGIFASIAYSLVDTFFVAKLGTDELAAISFCFPVVMIVVNLMMGIGTGVSSVRSRYFGGKNFDLAKKSAKQGLLLTFFISSIIALLGVISIPFLFSLLGVSSPFLMKHVQDYMYVWYIGAIFMGLAMVGGSIFRAKGNVFYPSLVLVLGAILNAIFDPILIFGLGPIPAMGVLGASLTTAFGNGFSAFLILRRLKKEEGISFLSIFKEIDFKMLKSISTIATPTALANSFTPFSTAVTNWLLVSYGSAAVAANSIATRVETIPFIAIFALASVLSPFTGQNWGAKNLKRVQEGIKKAFIFSYLLGFLAAAVLILKKEAVSAAFDSSPEVVQITSLYFSMIPLTYGLLGTVFLGSHAMNAIGKPFSANLLSASRLVLIYLPLAFFLNFHFGMKGIFYARLFANLVVGGATTLLTYRIFFKKSALKQLYSHLKVY